MTLWTSVVCRPARATAMLQESERMLDDPGSEVEIRHEATQGDSADCSVSARELPTWKVPAPKKVGDHAGT